MLGLRLSCLLGVFENSDIRGPKVFVIPQSTCLGSNIRFEPKFYTAYTFQQLPSGACTGKRNSSM
jgi:hypothetical protein